ncbi:hypothetical protein [Leucobacter allii]|uniref:hypothetical protein n=1 Tax=Leucobacter allii TaxID=2932247 RepID=UPI003D2A390E
MASTTAPRTLRSARPDLAAELPVQAAPERNVPEGTEVRGFALYVGLADDKIADGDPRLGAIVTRIKQLVAELSPAAETYAAVALAPRAPAAATSTWCGSRSAIPRRTRVRSSTSRMRTTAPRAA